MESMLMTPENNRLPLTCHDGIWKLRIEQLVWETYPPRTEDHDLALVVTDEANLVL